MIYYAQDARGQSSLHVRSVSVNHTRVILSPQGRTRIGGYAT